MKATVYYFTGTGNSLAVAKDIVEELGGELISIPHEMGKDTIRTDAKVVVIIFPVYMWGIPLIIKRFLKNFKTLKDKDIYAIVTHSGMPGITMNTLETVIQTNGGKLTAGFTVNMPGNYIPKYGAFTEKKQQKLFDNCSKKMKIISEYIKANQGGKIENNNILSNLVFSSLLHNRTELYNPKLDKNFWIDSKCNNCGICRNICPVSNIDINNGKPKWKNSCEQCFACLQWCPQEAIQYGEKTSLRTRYHHPKITISDMLNQANK